MVRDCLFRRLYSSQMCARRIVRHIEEAWLGCFGLLTTDGDILELATMKMFLVHCNEGSFIAASIGHVALIQNRHVAPFKSMRPHARFIREDGIMEAGTNLFVRAAISSNKDNRGSGGGGVMLCT